MLTHNSAVVICEKSNFQTNSWIITRNTVVDMATLCSYAMTLTGLFSCRLLYFSFCVFLYRFKGCPNSSSKQPASTTYSISFEII